MPLGIGTRLGPYEILSALGAGGMGEVYRARDSRLGREVAVKVLPAGFAKDEDRLARFEREARAASALSDPHIVTVFDVGREGDTHYFVSELVEGSDLRHWIERGPVPVKKALEIAEQIASGLAAAHEKGIVHRDLKPENVLITKAGSAKISDFGLAKLSESSEANVSNLPTSDGRQTTAGVVMGTVTYMSPEQARGSVVDFRSDQFSFGSMFYEMLSGRPAFKRASTPETLSAIIRDEPEPLERIAPGVALPIPWLVERCLAKEPQERFVSTRDLARDLGSIRQHLSSSSASGSVSPVATPARRRLPIALAGPAVLAAAILGVLLWRRPASPGPPTFQQITFRRGAVTGARFTPDGQSIVYSARWGGKRDEIYSVRPASPESRPLEISDATLLAVSSGEELAVRLRPKLWSNFVHGTLGRVPFGGGVPREIIENVQDADWTPDGGDLAVLRFENAVRWAIELPPGKALFEDPVPIAGIRLSPDARSIAVAEGGFLGLPTSLRLLDRQGKSRVLAAVPVTGVAWTPGGKEIWFSQDDGSGSSSLWAIDLAGKKRLLLRHAGSMVLRDINRDGALLVSVGHPQMSVMFKAANLDAEQDLAWLDGSQAEAISEDGKTILLNETGVGAGIGGAFYLRRADGSPAVRLADGLANALSSDGKWVAGRPRESRERAIIVPTGAGATRTVPLPFPADQWWFFPDGRRILIDGVLPDGKSAIVAIDFDGRNVRKMCPDGWDTFFGEVPISPDGKWIAAQSAEMENVALRLFPTDGSLAGKAVPGFEPDDVVTRWTADGRSLYVFKRNELPARVFRLDVETGKRTPLFSLLPADSAGVSRIPILVMTADARTYAYNITRELSDLYLIRGLK
ncbi:MAG: protein kinase domain-containing protein [Thermoanaerobaculia bacterium]